MSVLRREVLIKDFGLVDFYPNFLTSTTEERHFFDALLEQTDWEERTIRIFGKRVLQPRLVAWYGDPAATYTYSGEKFEPLPWFQELTDLKNRVESLTKESFNSALLNLYRDGNDSMGAHRDNEPELGRNPMIASVSLGQTRRIIFRQVANRKHIVQKDLNGGSLLVMRGETQNAWKHEIPKQRSIEAPRINITFRKILP